MRPTNSKSRVAEAVILPSGHRRLSEVRVPVRFVDVFNQTPTVGYVKTLLGRCNRKMFLNLVCALSSMTHNNVGVSMEPRWHADFVHDLDPPQGKKTVLKFLAEGRILLSDLQLGLLARYGAQFCTDGPNVGEFNDVVLRILLSANDLVLRAQEAAASTGPAAFFKVEVQSSALPDERFAHVLARFKKFFDWFDAQDVASPDWLPLRIDFERLLGMRVEEYLAAGFAVLTHFLSIREAKDLGACRPSFNPVEYGATLSERSKLDAWIASFSAGCADTTEPSFAISDLSVFIEKPMLVLDGQVYCPLPSLLEDTLNTRLFLNLYDAYERHDGVQAARRFSRLQGRFLEEYVVELVGRMSKPGIAVNPEREYQTPFGQRKSTDVVAIRPDGAALFTEVARTRLRLTESVLRLDEAAVRHDLKLMVVKKARQIQNCVGDVRAGLCVFPEDVTTVAALVVSGQSVPGLFYLKHVIDEELKNQGIFQDGTPWTQCDVEELEMLAASPGVVDLYELLVEKANHPDLLARRQSLKNYVYYFRPELNRKREAAETVSDGFETLLPDIILPVLRSWGLKTAPP